MILLDLHGSAIAGIIASSHQLKEEVTPEFIKHVIVNSIKNVNSRFRREYGELIICSDSKYNWRKSFFKQYKANRDIKKAQSLIDWDVMFNVLDELKLEIREYFPFRIIGVDRAEADDIIGYIAKKATTPTLIVSNDLDFIQCQVNPNVKQYAPNKKDFVYTDKKMLSTTPEDLLKEKIIRGDTGDGVPNILSDDDTLVTKGKRQKPLGDKKISAMLKNNFDEIAAEYDCLDQINRNKIMIDLDMVPGAIKREIETKFNEEQSGSIDDLRNFFVLNKMRMLSMQLDLFLPGKESDITTESTDTDLRQFM